MSRIGRWRAISKSSDTVALTGTWSFPTTIWFGAGTIARLVEACRAAGMARPLLVTDPGLAALPMVSEAIAANAAAGLATGLFAAVRANPVGANVDDGVAAFRAGGHDGVIAFGGGSALDTGKAVALMSGQSLPLWTFAEGTENWRHAEPAGIAPIVAVPTTAGTGSETGRAVVIVEEATREKRIIFHPAMLPAIVIADPVLTMGLPPAITAATGMDALAHNLEAYCAPAHNPFCDGVAVEGMRLIKDNLPRAVRDGGDLAARAQMLAAAAMGATAFQKGLGAIHALSHPVGAHYDTHHGLTNAIVMPYVVAFNRPAIAAKFDRLAAYLGLGDGGFDAVLAWILGLREQIGIPHTLAELGVEPARVAALAEMAAVDPTAGGNPVPVGPAELAQLYRDALDGRLP